MTPGSGQDWLLLDGHNRLAICQKHSIAYKTVTCDCADREDAKTWIIKNQLGRRNLSDAQRVRLALMLKAGLEAKAKERQAHGQTAPGKTLGANLPQACDGKVRDQIAAAAGVSPRTVDKVERVIERGAPALTQAMERGEVSIDAAAQVEGPSEGTKLVLADAIWMLDKTEGLGR